MPFYENVFIARQDISLQQVDGLVEGFTGVVRDSGGEMSRTEYWGLRNLTFRIKKNRKGHYVLMNFTAPAAAVSEMERQMRINEDIVRFMTVRLETQEEGPSIMMQTRAAREGGRRDGRPRDRDRDRDRSEPSGGGGGESRTESRPAGDTASTGSDR